MKRLISLLALGFAAAAHAYTPDELREDCRAADDFYAGKKTTDPYASLRSARCISYVAGFADGYAVSDYLAEQVGFRLNAFCLPNDPDLTPRLVRAVLARLEILPPKSTGSTATLVTSALANAFACPESLEPKK